MDIHLAPVKALIHMMGEVRRAPEAPVPVFKLLEMLVKRWDLRERIAGEMLHLRLFSVMLEEGSNERLGERVMVELFVELGHVRNTRFHRVDALGDQLLLCRVEVVHEPPEVGVDEQRPVVEGAVLRTFERAPRYLAPIDEDIVSSRSLGGNTKLGKRVDNDAEVLFLIVLIETRHEGEVGVPEVLIDRASAALPAGKVHPVFLHFVDIALFPGILVAPDDHRIGVSPKKENAI